MEIQHENNYSELKIRITAIQRKIARFLCAIIILGISIGTPVVLAMAVVETFKVANAAIDAVEPYCAARYDIDVTAYKTCIKQQANEILKDITDEIVKNKKLETGK